jgi:exodeoxyribonuclease VII small subunit
MSQLPPLQSFEEAYQRLSEIVDQLERGALSLEESLALYERGRALIAFCQQKIENAELRIQRIDSSAEASEELVER